MGGVLESRCVCRVYGADGAVHGPVRTVHLSSRFLSENIKIRIHGTV